MFANFAKVFKATVRGGAGRKPRLQNCTVKQALFPVRADVVSAARMLCLYCNCSREPAARAPRAAIPSISHSLARNLSTSRRRRRSRRRSLRSRRTLRSRRGGPARPPTRRGRRRQGRSCRRHTRRTRRRRRRRRLRTRSFRRSRRRRRTEKRGSRSSWRTSWLRQREQEGMRGSGWGCCATSTRGLLGTRREGEMIAGAAPRSNRRRRRENEKRSRRYTTG